MLKLPTGELLHVRQPRPTQHAAAAAAATRRVRDGHHVRRWGLGGKQILVETGVTHKRRIAGLDLEAAEVDGHEAAEAGGPAGENIVADRPAERVRRVHGRLVAAGQDLHEVGEGGEVGRGGGGPPPAPEGR